MCPVFLSAHAVTLMGDTLRGGALPGPSGCVDEALRFIVCDLRFSSITVAEVGFSSMDVLVCLCVSVVPMRV